MELQGFICDFWEQGMEESPWHIFQDARFIGPEPGGWQREGIHQFQDGDHLTILAEDESVLWSGTFVTRKNGLFSKLHAGSCEWHPLDVPQAQWESWFVHQPPLRARYRPVTSSP